MIPELGHFALIARAARRARAGRRCRSSARSAATRALDGARAAGGAGAVRCSSRSRSAASRWRFVDQRFLGAATSRSNSNSQLPLHYRFAAAWGAHEGSLLLWVLMLDVLDASRSPLFSRQPAATTWSRACSA